MNLATRNPSVIDATIARLRRKGWTAREIAAQVGLSPEQVYLFERCGPAAGAAPMMGTGMIVLPPELASRLAAIAAARGVTVDALAEAMLGGAIEARLVDLLAGRAEGER